MCRKNSDCSNGEKCIDSKCVIPCTHHNQCQNNEACANMVCLVGCRSSRDCSSSESCINNKCRGNKWKSWKQFTILHEFHLRRNQRLKFLYLDPCRGGNVCGPNAICSCIDHIATCSCPMGFQGNPAPQQGCVRAPSSCASTHDCPSQHVCISGQCRCECKESSECAQGERCINSVCTKICYGDSNCLRGELCVNGNCEKGCTSNAGCRDDEVCAKNKCKWVQSHKYFIT